MKKQASTSRGRGVPRSGEARAKGAHKLAPLLDSLVSSMEAEKFEPVASMTRAELRALLAVARAALYDQRVRRETFPEMEPSTDSAWMRLDRALSRLARAGKSRGDA